MQVTRGLPEPSLVWLGPLPELPALLPARGKPSSREERRGRPACAKGSCLSMDRAWKMGHPAQGLLRSREVASAQGICVSASCPCCLVAREGSMLGSLPAETKSKLFALEKVKKLLKLQEELRNPLSLAACEGTDHSDLCFQRLLSISSQKAAAV